MKPRLNPVTPFVLLLCSTSLWADTRNLMNAVQNDDVFTTLRELRQGTNPNGPDASGITPLETAVRNGNFEMCKFLLWHGAKAFDQNGRKIAERVPPTGVDGSPNVLNHLLRAYAFLQENRRAPATVRRPELTVIYEQAVDYEHPQIKPFYYLNQAERNGRKGVDDDSNGFVDDVYGWASKLNTPYEVSDLQRKSFRENAPLVEDWIKLYNAEKVRPLNQKPDAAWRSLQYSFKNPLAKIFGPLEGNSDKDFLIRVIDMSHGSHVAGIVINNSNRKAKVHTVSWGVFAEEEAFPAGFVIPPQVNFDALVRNIEDQMRPDFTKAGMRGSDYLRSLAPGVVNASMGLIFESCVRLAGTVVDRFVAERELIIDDSDREEKIQLLATELYLYRSIPYAIAGSENPNTLFVVAAGNDAADNDMTLQSPAYFSRYFPNTITIAAATKPAGEISDYSNFGKQSVNLAAPGNQILSAGFGIKELYMNGTSMAAPAVAGCAALIRSMHPEITAAKLRRILENSGDWNEDWTKFVTSGATLNIQRALKLADNDPAELGETAYQLVRHFTPTANPEAICDALDYSAKAVFLNARDSELWWDRAIVLRTAGSLSEALKAIDSGIAIDGKRPGLWRYRGIILENLESADDALKSYDKAVALVRDPATSENAKLSWALIPRARLLKKLDRVPEARKDVAEIITAEGGDAVPDDLADLQ